LGQEVKTIELDKLRLWTENPRDPIDSEATDAEIIRRAIDNSSSNWNLDKMLSDLGNQYFYNDLPTVVEDSLGNFVVYGGNRRVALLKCIQDTVLYSEATGKLPWFNPSEMLVSQTSLPCNVCDKATALDIVEKYHKSSEKWGKLQYEHFLNVHRGEPKGKLMLLNEATGGLVEKNPKLNEEYVQRTLLTDRNLNDIGFAVIENTLVTIHSSEKAESILDDIAKVRNSDLTNARKNPGKLKEALIELDPDKYKLIEPFREQNGYRPVVPKTGRFSPKDAPRRPQLSKKKETIFGCVLRPNGERSNLIYRAIEDIYSQYSKSPSNKFYLLPIIGFSLRLFLETIAQEYYEAQMPSTNNGDKALSCFLKEVAKPHFRNCTDSRTLNTYSLLSDWINGDINLEAVIGKWAHGSLEADNEAIIRHSKIIAEIVRELWWRN
jgi:hypothetical protein